MATSRTRGRGDRDVTSSSPPSDAYTGLLAISLVAMITACVFLFLDWSAYGQKQPGPAPAPSTVKPNTPAAGGQPTP